MCSGTRLPIKANQALPRDGKSVTAMGHDQSHPDAAWTEVEPGIERTPALMREHAAGGIT
jgi:hypothetical protein